MDFLLSLTDNNGNEITPGAASDLYSIVINIINESDSEVDDLVTEVAIILEADGWIFDFNNLRVFIEDELD